MSKQEICRSLNIIVATEERFGLKTQELKSVGDFVRLIQFERA